MAAPCVVVRKLQAEDLDKGGSNDHLPDCTLQGEEFHAKLS